MRLRVRLLRPLHVSSIHVSVGWNFDLEAAFSLRFMHDLYRVFHQRALLHLVLLDLDAVFHYLAGFGGKALPLSPRRFNLLVELFIVFLNVFGADKGVVYLLTFLVIGLFDLRFGLGVRGPRRSQICDELKVSRRKETAQILHMLRLDIVVDHACSFGHLILQVLARCLQTFLFHSSNCSRRVHTVRRLSRCNSCSKR